MNTQALPFKNPEVLGPMGFELPQMPDIDLQENLKKSFAVGGSLVAMGAGAVGAVAFFGKAEKANAGVEVCTAPTGEIPTPQSGLKVTGVDLMGFVPALTKKLCVGNESSTFTYFQNVGDKTANNAQFSVIGRADVAKTITGIKINDRSIKIIETNQTPIAGEEFCTRQVWRDRTNKVTTGVLCSWGLQPINIEPMQKVKFEAVLNPTKTIIKNMSDLGPYIAFSAGDTPMTDLRNLNNNIASKNIEVLNSDGNSGTGGVYQPACNSLPTLTLEAPKKTLNGRGTVKTIANTIDLKISGKGNGASKLASQRQKAARIVVITSAKTGKLPKDMRRIGNKIFIDIPKTGVVPGKPVLDRIPFTSRSKVTKFSATFIAPAGTIIGCNRGITANTKILSSTNR